MYKLVLKNSGIYLCNSFNNLQKKLNEAIENTNQKHLVRICKKLNYPSVNSKCYWSLLKTLFDDNKIQGISPAFHKNTYKADFKEKSEFFNSIFSKQWFSV